MDVKRSSAILSRVVIILGCVIIVNSSLESIEQRSLTREKRWLLFPSGTNVIQLIIGVAVPVEVKPETVLFGWAFRGVYVMPDNLSQLVPMDYGSSRREERATVSRWSVYKSLEMESEIRGFGGRACILRSICEASDIPFNKFLGIYEEFFHSIFTPTTTREELDHHTDNEYYAAQTLGRRYRGKCRQLFPECEKSFMEMFSYSLAEDDVT